MEIFGLSGGALVALVLLGLVIYIIYKGVFIIPQQECVIVERLGKFHTILNSGLNILIPIIDKPRVIYWTSNGRWMPVTNIDLREVVLDIPEQQVITHDNVSMAVDAIIYLQITDPKRTAYEIQHLPLALSQLTQTTLRSLIGEMELDHTLSSRDNINTRLKHTLDDTADKWGIKVTRVEIKNITPAHDIQVAMEKQMQAERERRAQVLQAEGTKQSKILEAEGDKRSRIERSEGEKQEKINQALGDREGTIARAEGQASAILAVAQAQANAIKQVQSALGDSNSTIAYMIAMEYLKKFGEMTQKSTDKVFIPYEASGILSSLGSIKELIGKVQK